MSGQKIFWLINKLSSDFANNVCIAFLGLQGCLVKLKNKNPVRLDSKGCLVVDFAALNHRFNYYHCVES